MADTRLAQIAEQLLEKSRLDQVAWQETVVEDVYALNLADSSVMVEQRGDRVRLRVLNESGTELEATSWAQPGSWDALSVALTELFQLARKRALQTDERLDALLQAMQVEGNLGGDALRFQ